MAAKNFLNRGIEPSPRSNPVPVEFSGNSMFREHNISYLVKLWYELRDLIFSFYVTKYLKKYSGSQVSGYPDIEVSKSII